MTPVVLILAGLFGCDDSGVSRGEPRDFNDVPTVGGGVGGADYTNFIEVGDDRCNWLDNLIPFCIDNPVLPVGIDNSSGSVCANYFRAIATFDVGAREGLGIGDTRSFTLTDRPTDLDAGEASVEIWYPSTTDPDVYTSLAGNAQLTRIFDSDLVEELFRADFVASTGEFLDRDVAGPEVTGRIHCQRADNQIE